MGYFSLQLLYVHAKVPEDGAADQNIGNTLLKTTDLFTDE